ncbi:MAG: hypothetical protein WAO28_00595 [Candidatus Microsaccharimonas sp.]
MNMLVRSFEGSPDEVSGTVDLVQKDLAATYEAQGDTEQAAYELDPSRRLQLETDQLEQYQSGHGDRFGVVDTTTGNIVSMAMVSEWLRGDHYPFSTPLGRAGLQGLRLAHIGYLPTRPVGLHTLVVDRELSKADQLDVAMLTGVEVINLAENREIRTSLPENDPAERALQYLGFVATGRFGERLKAPGITQQLYVRKRI